MRVQRGVGSRTVVRQRPPRPIANKLVATTALSVSLLAPNRSGAAGPDAGASALHTAFLFLTTSGDGSGKLSYDENYKQTLVVTTPFQHWTCFRSDVTLDARGSWYGGFTCVATDGSDAAVSTFAECSPNTVTPMAFQSMIVSDKVNGKDVVLRFYAGCATSTEVPLRGGLKP